jgi:8-oxo-dGTP pyrophosphatase MutT (NUDIX family)
MPSRPRRPDEISAGAVVVRCLDDRWEVCLIRVGDAWSLPKGNLEAGESEQAAAVREVAEETGLPAAELRVITTLPSSEYAYRRRDGRLVFKRVVHFLIETPGQAPLRAQVGEVDDVAWVPLDEAPQRVAYKDLRAALAAAQAFLSARAV